MAVRRKKKGGDETTSHVPHIRRVERALAAKKGAVQERVDREKAKVEGLMEEMEEGLKAVVEEEK